MEKKEKCTLNIYEIKPIIKYKERWGMKFVDIDNSNETEEVLIKSYVLNLLDATLGEEFNYKERSIEPDNWCRDFEFEVEISDELKEFLNIAKDANPYITNDTILALRDGTYIPKQMERELNNFANNWLYEGSSKKGFRYAISPSSNGRDIYTLEKTPHYIVKLDIRNKIK